SRLLRSGSKIVVPSCHMRRLLQVACGVSGNIEVIPCFPDVSRMGQYASVPRNIIPTVSAVGRLTPKKNPLALIEAFSLVLKAVPDAHLHLVGDGELREQVRHRVQEKGLASNITLHGALPQEK